jgi:hypothetical protein
MTIDQAIDLCQHNGIANPTAQDIKLAGFEPGQWAAGFTPSTAAVTPDDLKAQVTAVLAAGVAANVPVQVLAGVVSVGKIALSFL